MRRLPVLVGALCTGLLGPLVPAMAQVTTNNGALDSLGIVNLVSFLESSYGITIEDHEIVPANLGSLTSIERYVLAKMN